MPRRDLVFHEGHYYHLYNRAENNRNMFVEADNYVFFLKKLKKILPDFDLVIIAYCLLPDRFHLCVRLNDEIKVPLFVSRLLNSYVKAFNKKYHKNGRMFGKRYKPIPIYSAEFLMFLCRHIHLKPVEARLARKPGDWPFSNYLEFTGKRDGKLLDRTFRDQLWGNADAYEKYALDDKPKVPTGFNKILYDE